MSSPVQPSWREAVAGIRQPVLVVGLVMVGAQLLHRAWAVYSGFFYFDDYLLLHQAQERGLTLGYLTEPFNSHVMPGSRALIWLVEASGPLNWGLAATITLLMQAAAGLAALWMLVVLFGPRWGVLAPLAIYLTTASTAQATLWWISSINQISIQATFFVAVGAWVQYLRTRRLGWLAATAGAVAVGLLFFQKALLVLPVLVLLAFVYFAAGGPVARLRHLVRSYWPALVMIGGLAAAYAVYSLFEVRQPFTGGRDVDVGGLVWNMTSNATLAAWGGPWDWRWKPGGSWADAPLWLEATTLAATLLLAAYTVLRSRRAVWGWLLVAGYLAIQVVLVATSRAPVFGADIGLAYRLQTDVACALVVGLGLALMPVRDAVVTIEPRELPLPAPPARWVAAVVALVAVSGLACWTAYAVTWHAHNDSEGYLRTLDRDLQRQGRALIADRYVPETVMPAAFFGPDHNRVSMFTRLLGRPADFPAASPRLAVVAKDGSLHQGLLEPAAEAAPGPVPDCGWLGRAPRLRVPLAGTTYDLSWWLRIGYLSNASDRVVIEVGGDRIPATVTQGLGSLYLRTTGALDEVVVSDLDPGTRLCVDVVEVGDMVVGPAL